VLAGSMGTLGVITEVSLKVLPQAPAEVTLACHLPQADALALLHRWGAQPLPLNASCWVNDTHTQPAQDMLFVRLRGAVAAVDAAVPRMCADVTALGGQAAAIEHFIRLELLRLRIKLKLQIRQLCCCHMLKKQT
jgi:glycolate oxidase FAD binding subunit